MQSGLTMTNIYPLANEQCIDILRDWGAAVAAESRAMTEKEQEAFDAYTELALEAAKRLRGRL